LGGSGLFDVTHDLQHHQKKKTEFQNKNTAQTFYTIVKECYYRRNWLLLRDNHGLIYT
jgi:hypothetical protein